MAHFIVNLKTQRVISQFDELPLLENCLVNHFDESQRASVGVFVGRWVDSWDGPYLVPSVEYLERCINERGSK